MPPKTAGKRQLADEEGNPKSSKETDQINEDALLKEDDSSPAEWPSRSEIAIDSLEQTLENVNSNMLTVVNSLGSMSKALERLSNWPRPSKRQKTRWIVWLRQKFKRWGKKFDRLCGHMLSIPTCLPCDIDRWRNTIKKIKGYLPVSSSLIRILWVTGREQGSHVPTQG